MKMSEYRSIKKKSSKYKNKITEYSGKQYHSKKEANRAMELDLLSRAGIVRQYETQPKFKIQHNGVSICTYIADFKVEYGDGTIEFEDVKGFKTSIYNLKKKLVQAFYGITIKEI